MPPSCAPLGGFAIGARLALLWQHNRNMRGRAHASGPRRTSHASPVIKSTRLLRAPFHFVHSAGVLQRERIMLGSTCLCSLYA